MSIRYADAEAEYVPDWVPEDEPYIDPAGLVEMIGADGRVRMVEARSAPAVEPAAIIAPEPPAPRLQLALAQSTPAPLPVLQFPKKAAPLYDVNGLDIRDTGVLSRHYLSRFLEGVVTHGTEGLEDIGAVLMLLLRLIDKAFTADAKRTLQIERLKPRPGQPRLFEV